MQREERNEKRSREREERNETCLDADNSVCDSFSKARCFQFGWYEMNRCAMDVGE